MDLRTSDWDRLNDLALIYMALALGTDSVLDDSEMTQIGEKLRSWHPEAGDDRIHRALNEALGISLGESAIPNVTRSVRNLKDQLSDEERILLLTQLVELAAADGVFWNEEGTFIQALRQAWEVHVPPERLRPVVGTETPSEEESAENGANWSTLHDLALIYLALAFGTDGHLTDREAEIIVEKLQNWKPEAGHQEIEDIVREASSAYVQGLEGRSLTESLDAVKESVPEERRATVLADLLHIARADGSFQENERKLIRALASAWGLEVTS